MCVQENSGKFVAFLVLCVDNILLIGNDIGVLTTIKIWLAKQFDMKDLGEISYILGIKLLRDRKNKTLALSQAVYIDKILARFSMEIPRLVYYHSDMELHSLRINHLNI